jgi:hypothetical protein
LGPIFDSSAALRNHLVAENQYLKTSILSASLGGRGPSSDDDGIDDPRSVVRMVAVGGGDRVNDSDINNSDTDGDENYSDGDSNDGDGDDDDDGITDSDSDSSINIGSDGNSDSRNNDDDDDEGGDESTFEENQTIGKLRRKSEFKMESDSQERGGKENHEKIHSKIRDRIKVEKESIYDPRSLVKLNGGEGESDENMEEGSEENTDTVEDGEDVGNEYKMMIDFDASDVPDVDAYLTDYRSKVDDVLKDLLSDLKDTDTDADSYKSQNEYKKEKKIITGKDKNKNPHKNKSKVISITSNTNKKTGINKGKSSDNSQTLRKVDAKKNVNYSLLENNENNTTTSPISEFAKNALKYKSMLLCFFVAVIMHYSIVSGILK